MEETKIYTIIVSGALTILAGLSVAFFTQYQIRKRSVEESHRGKKVEIYSKFLRTIENILQSANGNKSIKKISDKELVNILAEYKTNIILWGSPKVLKAQAEYEEKARRKDNIMLALDKLYRAIREDIGLSNKGLNQLDLIKLYLNNPEELDSFINKNTTIL